MSNQIPADLITPLGAYVRLRGDGPSFLLESVDQGRLGRYSFLGSGTRVVGLAEAEAAVAGGSPVIGYVGYDYVAALEPSVPLPDDGRGLSESALIVADTLIRFDHLQGVADVMHGDAASVAGRLGGTAPELRDRSDDVPSATERTPDQATYELGVTRAQEHIPCWRRVPDRALTARGTCHAGDRHRPLSRAPASQPLPLPLPARAR